MCYHNEPHVSVLRSQDHYCVIQVLHQTSWGLCPLPNPHISEVTMVTALRPVNASS